MLLTVFMEEVVVAEEVPQSPLETAKQYSRDSLTPATPPRDCHPADRNKV